MKYLFQAALLTALFFVGFAGLQAQSALGKANKQYELHAYNLAARSYLSIIEKQPNNVEALSKLADCYWRLNRMPEAKAYFERAIDTGKADPRTYFQYGQTFKAIAQYDSAKVLFQVYAKTYPLEGSHFAESCDFAMIAQNQLSEYELSSEPVNTSSAEFGPAFFLEDIVFSSSRIDMKRSDGNQTDWTGGANNQLFRSARDQNGLLAAPSFLRPEIRNIYNEGPVSYSADGRWVVITKNNFIDGSRQIPVNGLELSLYIAEVNDRGDWVNALPFPHNGTGYSNGFGCFSPDGGALYFASNRPDGFGGFDLFVSRRQGASWSAPENLGPTVNSAGDEITPFVEGGILYFASNWHKGFGGFDIFRSAQAFNNSWSSPVNMGSGINSPRDDYGFIFNSSTNQGYLVSNRVGGKGHEDIYRVQKAQDNIVFIVLSASDKTPIANATIDLTSCGHGRPHTDNNGIFTLRSVSGLNCSVEIAKEGFQNETLSLTSLGGTQGRNFEIFLKKFGDDYFGGIVNVMTGVPLDGALVRAISQTDGSILEAFTDPRGSYALALKPFTSYVIRYSRPGFIDVSRTMRTTDGVDKSILGTISITPSTAVMGAPTLGAIDVPEPAAAAVTSETIPEGHSVQVAAMPAGRPVDLDPFRKKLGDIGNVYIQEEGGFQKVRIGPFATDADARRALQGAKGKGYKTAFMVRQAATTLTPRGVPASDVPQQYSAKSAPIPASGAVMVRLAAYKNVSNFSDQSVNDIGVVEKRERGPFTVVLLSGYSSREEAQKALATAKQRGFNGAHLVTETAPGEFVRAD